MVGRRGFCVWVWLKSGRGQIDRRSAYWPDHGLVGVATSSRWTNDSWCPSRRGGAKRPGNPNEGGKGGGARIRRRGHDTVSEGRGRGLLHGAWPDLLQLPASPSQRRHFPARHFLAPPPLLAPLLLFLVLLLAPPAGPTRSPPGFEFHLGFQFPLQDVASKEGGQRQLRAGRCREILEADGRHRPGGGHGGLRPEETPRGTRATP